VCVWQFHDLWWHGQSSQQLDFLHKVTDVWVQHPRGLSFGSLTFGSMIQSLSFPALDHKGGTWNFEFPPHPSSPPRLYIKEVGNQVSQFPLGNFPKSWDLLLGHRRDLDLGQKQQQRPSYWRRLPLLRAAAFFFYKRHPSLATFLKLQDGSNSLLHQLPWGSPWWPQIVA
jgi:hypothetical protein